MLRLGLEKERPLAPPDLTAKADTLDARTAPPASDAKRATAPDAGVDGGPFDPQRSFLLASFREFFAEVVRLRDLAVRDPGSLLPIEPSEYTPEHGAAQIARGISQQLQHLMEQLALDASVKAGEYGAALFGEAQYVMAAIADETFLATDWIGREAWLRFLLEQSVFRSQIAGEEIFRRIDKLLSRRTGVSAELAAVYFVALGAGFEGQYRGTGDPALREYRQKLYRFVFQRDPSRVPAVLSAQPYDHTAGAARPTRLPLVRRWTLIFAGAAIVYIAAAFIIWRSLTSELRQINSEIRREVADTVQVSQ
ncbi:MAG TPA: DotU family type IV/VI secretion system protein [Gemmatimonadaceae bacterium]|nr:DotU family type IV/VI secretion system protein [Gemmatimonadaceae bacterium]